MKKDVIISVSTLPIDDYQGVVEFAKALQGLTDFLHCDVGDGIFVSAKTYDQTVVYSINQNCLTMLDVHLMVNEPAGKVDGYIDAGANIVTVHYEAFEDKELLHSTLKHIRDRKTLAGLSFCPSTPISDVKLYFYEVDVVLIMSVEPGASGQKLLPDTIEKIKEIAAYRDANNLKFKIEVDGGVNAENAPSLVEAGADMLVSGNFVYKAQDREEAVKALRG